MTTATDNKPEPGKVYCLTAMMGKGKRWEDAEIRPTGLAIGQVISYSDMANPRQDAVVIEAGSHWGQKVVFLEDGHTSRVMTGSVKSDGHAGWQLVNRIMTETEMAIAVMFASKRRIELDNERKAEADAKTVADVAEKERILAAYPWLEPIAGSKKSNHALAASNLKRELARLFPATKFSVTSDSFSMGDSVDVRWTDGPLQDAVQKICDKYQDGTFDGMTDCAGYVPTVWSETFGNTRFCNANRHESEALTRKAATMLGHTGELTVDAYGVITGLDYERTQEVYRLARTLEG